MKLFKTVDEKLMEIGFQKINDDEYAVTYERKNEMYGYTQILDIIRKASGRHILQSYDKNLFDDKMIGNTCVGLSYYEMKLATKKMKMKMKEWRV
jgi:hypothetical protein